MTSLAEQIIKNNSENLNPQPSAYECDEYGIPTIDEYGKDITDTVDYLIARTLRRETQARDYTPKSRHRLYTYQGKIYRGNEVITETSNNAHKLAVPKRPMPVSLQTIYWEKLKEIIPELSRDKIIISDNLYWNKPKGELECYRKY